MTRVWTDEQRRAQGEIFGQRIKAYWAQRREQRLDPAAVALIRLTKAVDQFQRDCPNWRIKLRAYPTNKQGESI
jgi:hypothetical protein